MRSIDTLVPPIENDNSGKLSEDNTATIKAIEEMATAMKEVVESSTSNTNKTLETFKTAFDKQFTTPLNGDDNKIAKSMQLTSFLLSYNGPDGFFG